MKPLFIIGVPRIEPYSFVEENELKGLYAPIHYAVNYYLYEKFNVSLIDLGPRITDECFENGYCSGSLFSMQSGTANFVDDFVQSQFPTLPINLTLGSSMKQEECHLINRPEIQIDLRANDYLASIHRRFDQRMKEISIAFCVGFAILFKLTNKLSSDLTSKEFTLWSLHEIAFGRRHLRLVSNLSVVGLVFSWFIFLFILIASSAFQTGLIRTTSFVQIDNLQDILTYSRVPTAFKYRFCRFPIEKSNSPIFKRISSKLDIIDPENLEPIKIFELMSNSSHVLIADKFFGIRFKGFLCTINGDKKAMSNPLYTSKRPIEHIRFLLVISSSTDPQTAQIAIRSSYAAFETSNLDNPVIKVIDYKCAGLKNYYGKCTRAKINENNIIITSLTIRYFNRGLMILGVASAIGFIVFLIELMCPPVEEGKTSNRKNQLNMGRSRGLY